MSLTPTDRRDGQTEPSQERESDRETTLWSRCRALAARLGERVADRLTGSTPDPSDPPLPDHAAAPPECPPVDSLPARSLPLTYPTRARDDLDNDSELVVERDGDTIVLAHPAADDARLESDTWVSVEQ